MSKEIVRVVRLVTFTGPREIVEEQVRNSVHGRRRLPGGLNIEAVTIGEFPDVMDPQSGFQPHQEYFLDTNKDSDAQTPST